MNKKTTILVSLLLAFVLSLMVTVGCQVKREDEQPELALNQDNDRILLSEEDVMSASTHILEATFIGSNVNNKYSIDLMFIPKKAFKGELSEQNKSVIHVSHPTCGIDTDSQNPKTLIKFEKDKSYMLFLEKHISVYYEHDKFVQLGDLFVSFEDNKWNEYVEKVNTIVKNETPSVAMYGQPYSESNELEDVLKASHHIFVVRIDSKVDEGLETQTTTYSCQVLKTARNAPTIPGDIWVALFNNTVEIGKEYVLLLSDSTKIEPVYTLSSRNASVYSISEAQSIPELKQLLEQAIDYVK